MTVRLELGDCLEVLPRLRREGVLVDAVVTDPPYHLASVTKRLGDASAKPIQQGSDGAFARASAGFMGQKWDGGDVAFRVDTWRAVMDVMKPGAWLVAFGGPRTFHRMASAVEAAGFEIRDRLWNAVAGDTHVLRFLESLSAEQRDAFALAIEDSQFGGELAWLFGSGFPKPATGAGKAIDNHLGVKGETMPAGHPVRRMRPGASQNRDQTHAKSAGREFQPGAYVPSSEEGRAWDGWGFALKPANEPILLARKPCDEGSVPANMLKHGVGALNVGGCRVAGEAKAFANGTARSGGIMGRSAERGSWEPTQAGRWPANVVHDGSGEVVSGFPAEAGAVAPVFLRKGDKFKGTYGAFLGNSDEGGSTFRGDSGSAARFFYSSKATAGERVYRCRQCGAHRLGKPGCGHIDSRGNPDLHSHPTVKPIALKRWLVRLVCPPGGLVLDPFAGSGTTGAAAQHERCDALLIERERDYAADICIRLGLEPGDLAPAPARAPAVSDHGPLFGREAAE